MRKFFLSLFFVTMILVFSLGGVYSSWCSPACSSDFVCSGGSPPQADTMNCKCPGDNELGTCRSASDKGKLCWNDGGCNSGDCNGGKDGKCEKVGDYGNACWNDGGCEANCNGGKDGICADYDDAGASCYGDGDCDSKSCSGDKEGTCSYRDESCCKERDSDNNCIDDDCDDGGDDCWVDSDCSGDCNGAQDGICDSAIDAGQACHDSCTNTACIGDKDGTCGETIDAGQACHHSCKNTACIGDKDGTCDDYNDAGFWCSLQIFSGCKGGCSGSSSGSYKCACNNAKQGVSGTCVPSQGLPPKVDLCKEDPVCCGVFCCKYPNDPKCIQSPPEGIVDKLKELKDKLTVDLGSGVKVGLVGGGEYREWNNNDGMGWQHEDPSPSVLGLEFKF
jgi:hypothetical protein